LKHPHKASSITPTERQYPIKNPNGTGSGAKQVSSTGLYAAAPLRSAPHKLLIRYTNNKKENQKNAANRTHPNNCWCGLGRYRLQHGNISPHRRT
jgi:hypothetical protein